MDNLISRQAAIDALTEYWHGIEDRHQTLDGEMAVYVDCKLIIKRLPSAQPEQRKGKWHPIIDGDPITGEPYQIGVYCDNCGFQSVNIDNFCPNCGADMRGDNDAVN